MNNRFKPGEVVFERTRPSQKLIVTQFREGIYYCQLEANARQRNLVFLERELDSVSKLAIEQSAV